MASSSGPPATQQSSSGPWPLSTAGIGGRPTTSLDVPITAVFLVLFILGAAAHMTILQVNLRRGKKFIISGMLFGFCMARITASVLRIAWATRQDNVRLAIAANIFMAAGVLLLFVINLIFTQRVIRATHPNWGWSKWFSILLKIYYASIVITLIALITSVVQQFYSLNPNTRRIDRDIQRFGNVYFAVASFLTIPLVLAAIILPRQTRVDKFGQGRFRTKIYVLLFSSTILTFGAAFRAGVTFVPRPVADPAWYHSKAVFYCINFLIEITAVVLYAAIRVDKRFIIPNKARGPGSYALNAQGEKVEGEMQRMQSLPERINDEEELFDGGVQEGEKSSRQGDVESGTTATR